MTNASVNLWGRQIGAVSWSAETRVASFEYAPAFVGSGIEIAPLTMPLSNQIYSFTALPYETFSGLPGALADSLPDDFGNTLIDAWLAREGRAPAGLDPVERLCYVGRRGMGALEYDPARRGIAGHDQALDIASLVTLAGEILCNRNNLKLSFAADDRGDALTDILKVGTSAGGARAKAIIAWNPKTNEVRSGQVETGEGFSYWLLKFDGVSGNRDKELEDPAGFGLIEFAYANMAVAAGITMMPCHLLTENHRQHFMARRFDRTDEGRKIHMQTLGGMNHFDYKKAGAYAYEQALQTIRRLGLRMDSVEQQFCRMTFNIVARNQDDHVKNIAFLMDHSGAWSLSPAYDMTYSYNPTGTWTGVHQMSLNGKRDAFDLEDFKTCARNASMKQGRAETIVREVTDAVRQWRSYASDAGVAEEVAERISRAHRLKII